MNSIIIHFPIEYMKAELSNNESITMVGNVIVRYLPDMNIQSLAQRPTISLWLLIVSLTLCSLISNPSNSNIKTNSCPLENEFTGFVRPRCTYLDLNGSAS